MPEYTYTLYNTATGEIEAVQPMTVVEASRRNAELREWGESQRWIAGEVE